MSTREVGRFQTIVKHEHYAIAQWAHGKEPELRIYRTMQLGPKEALMVVAEQALMVIDGENVLLLRDACNAFLRQFGQEPDVEGAHKPISEM